MLGGSPLEVTPVITGVHAVVFSTSPDTRLPFHRLADALAVRDRRAIEREDVVFGVFGQRGDLRQPGLKLSDCVPQPGPGLLERAGGEQRPDQGAERVVLLFADGPVQVA